jgi:hypothetical protein
MVAGASAPGQARGAKSPRVILCYSEWTGSQQAALTGAAHGLVARRSAELAPNAPGVRAHRVERQVQLGGDVAIGQVSRQHAQLGGRERLVAHHSGREEFAFRLSSPRYSAARRTVSYRATPLTKGTVAARAAAAAAAPRRFGAASLSVVPHPSLGSGDNGGNHCAAAFENDTWCGMAYVSSEKWDTDDWVYSVPDGYIAGSPWLHGDVAPGILWESDGGTWRGCANHTTWRLVTAPQDPSTSGVPPANVTIDFNLEWDWTQSPRFSCATSDPRFTCGYDNPTQQWLVFDTQRCPPAPGAACGPRSATARE